MFYYIVGELMRVSIPFRGFTAKWNGYLKLEEGKIARRGMV